ncbi:hypothetical protein SAY86_017326 [Trapa natans]|uniref:Uncharacterized protein n=1 Tax=Trapa natans TaxID=22666 RepID=A0AAN7R503_TRANT|nr:hypothetical protein SAY86_017326 [Trapa natans]
MFTEREGWKKKANLPAPLLCLSPEGAAPPQPQNAVFPSGTRSRDFRQRGLDKLKRCNREERRRKPRAEGNQGKRVTGDQLTQPPTVPIVQRRLVKLRHRFARTPICSVAQKEDREALTWVL